MLKESLSYPLEDEDQLKTIGIGGLLVLLVNFSDIPSKFLPDSLLVILLLPLAIISLLLLIGYLVQVLQSAARKEESAPAFTGWGSLLINGLKWLAVTIAYLLPMITMFVIAIVIKSSGGVVISRVVAAVAFVIALASIFLVPAAWTNVALTDRLGSAFEFRNIIDAALTGRYIIAVVFMVSLSGLSETFTGTLAIVLIGSIIQFYIQVVMFYLIGRSCGPNLHEEHTESVASD
jgi:hypothetical protein